MDYVYLQRNAIHQPIRSTAYLYFRDAVQPHTLRRCAWALRDTELDFGFGTYHMGFAPTDCGMPL